MPTDTRSWAERIHAMREEADAILRDREYISNRPREFHLWAGMAAQLYVAELYARALPDGGERR